MCKQNKTHPFPHGNPKCNSILSLFVISATSELNLASELLFQSSKHLYRSKENCFCKDWKLSKEQRSWYTRSRMQDATGRLHCSALHLHCAQIPLSKGHSCRSIKHKLHTLHCWNTAASVKSSWGKSISHTDTNGNAVSPIKAMEPN